MIFFNTQRHYLHLTMLAAPQAAKKLREYSGKLSLQTCIAFKFFDCFPY